MDTKHNRAVYPTLPESPYCWKIFANPQQTNKNNKHSTLSLTGLHLLINSISRNFRKKVEIIKSIINNT